MSDRLVRFPGSSWQEIEALPQPCAGRSSVRSSTCETSRYRPGRPFPRDDPLPGAYELHLPADDVTIWYTITEHEGQEVISVQQVSVDI